MDAGNTLADVALETLPITVAVVDENGEILLTNKSWRAFGPDDHRTDHVGVNYIATAEMDADTDEYARRAVEGIEAVIDGERETFTMEYPCHSPERKQWFLMWAKRFRIGGEVRVSVVHLDITERKLAEITAEETAAELREEHRTLEHVLERVDGLLRDVTDAAVGATTREEIERAVCSRLADTEPYVLAWIGRVDVTNRRLSPREWASAGDVPLEDGDLVLGSDESHPAVRALADGDAQVVQDLDSFDDAERWWPEGAGDRFRSVAALPLRYGDVAYGVLAVFADEPSAFSERELLVLDSLAGTISTAMNAIEARRMLATDDVVELELAIGDPDLFVAALATELEAAVTFRGLTDDEDGTPIAFFHADRAVDGAPDAAAIDGVADVRILSTYDGGTLLEAAVDDDIVRTISEHGGTVRRFETRGDTPQADSRTAAGDGIVDLTVDLPNGQAARSVYDRLDRRYDAVELISYHETERPRRTPGDVMARLESSLTDRQQTALRKAYYADYFEWPRNVSGEELAESMDISRSTFHQHLRTAQRKLLDELFTGDPTR
ncbi:putative PAS/PAC sensor protein [Haloterrigena turkmenica DSM 5511]|uniref:PAS/PAC sensor protein n=1 Tax=Haloterrigena turkmenica (strain ATCC 51198 / DSM 5511 / JCM 9101 / NCIMB 13204 / VKM B-1734 / 4k) TaxID=543526 RepID=D2RWS1_HALTV|nr:bacterio-opsin activator domain-containing protein [Haloterrigena turkmenica]ADB61572.1 putative PAS/PAC sensor protein [Haloterrigena turkmenica DSM 5511]